MHHYIRGMYITTSGVGISLHQAYHYGVDGRGGYIRGRHITTLGWAYHCIRGGHITIFITTCGGGGVSLHQ